MKKPKHQEDTKIMNSYLVNNIILKYTKLKLMDLHEQTDKSTIAGDFKAYLSGLDRKSRLTVIRQLRLPKFEKTFKKWLTLVDNL